MSKRNRNDYGLNQADFELVASNGFDDPENSYAHSMAYFQGRVYVGTTRNIFGLLNLFPPPDGAQMKPWPIKVPDSVEELDMRAQIWCWDPADESWTKVHTSPLIMGKQGKEVPRDLGYRGMVVYQGKSDPEPALYVSALSSVSRGTGARILRSLDGVVFKAVSEPGLGNPQVSTFRSLESFDGYLVAAPVGEGKTWNTTKAPKILRTRDPLNGVWELACEPGFGDENNGGIFELHSDSEFIYAGTFNHVEGYQVWRAPASGDAPWCWEMCLEKGAYRGSVNEMVMSFCTFGDAVYVGSGIQNGGYDRWRIIGPAAVEVVRINRDGGWDLIMGEPRDTPDGRKLPLSGHGPGFDNLFGGYLWRMVKHAGWIYVSTFDWSQCLSYATKTKGPYKKIVDHFGPAQIAREGGGFGIWKSRDGEEWVCVTANGFGNSYNYGARTFLSTPHGLFVGTANPFGPELAVQSDNDWEYLPNDRGGMEIWLGRNKTFPEGRVTQRPALAYRIGGARARPACVDHKNELGSTANRTLGRILLTGASGVMGRRLTALLVERGETVTALVACAEDQARVYPDPGVDCIVHDLASPFSIPGELAGFDTIFHLAEHRPGKDHAELMELNVTATENLMRVCRRNSGNYRIVFASSVLVYPGIINPASWPLDEESEIAPLSSALLHDYSHSKILAEGVIRRYCQDGGCEFVILRCAMDYGDGSGDESVFDQLVKRAQETSAPDDKPGDYISSQPIYVDDLVHAFYIAGLKLGVSNQVINVAGNEVVANLDILRVARRLIGSRSEHELEPDTTLTWRRYLRIIDTCKAENQLNFYPRTPLHEGVERYLEHLSN